MAYAVSEWISLYHFSRARWEDAAWHSLLYEELIKKNHAYSSNHKQFFCTCSQGKNLESINGKIYFIHLMFYHDLKASIEKEQPSWLGKGLQECTALEWTLPSSARSLCDTYTYVCSVCICTGITGQRCAFKTNLSNLPYVLCFIFQCHLGTHERHFFFARWSGK